MIARIEILTRKSQDTSRFLAVGKLERIENGVRMVYPIEGDESTLEIFPTRAVLKRRGETNYDAEFLAKKPSYFRLSLQDNAADLPIFTHVFKSFISDPDIFLNLTYDLDTGSELQKFFLKISIHVLWK